MAQSLSGKVEIKPTLTFTNSLDNSTVTDATGANLHTTHNIANGTAANQANVQWHDTRSLNTTTSETLDLTALVGGAFGNVNLAKAKYVKIEVVTTTTGYRLLVGGGSTTPFTACFADPSDILRIDAGGVWYLDSPVDGWTVDSTHKLLTIENPSGGTIQYKIWIAGVSA
jgi:hypothetical protein